jgi:hypothetical protein
MSRWVLAAALGLAACGSNSGGAAKPVIQTFVATPTLVVGDGGVVDLSWSVSQADTSDRERTRGKRHRDDAGAGLRSRPGQPDRHLHRPVGRPVRRLLGARHLGSRRSHHGLRLARRAVGDRAMPDGESRRDLSDAAARAPDGNQLLDDGNHPRALLPAELQHDLRAEHLRDGERIHVHTRLSLGAPRPVRSQRAPAVGEWQEWPACKSSRRAG